MISQNSQRSRIRLFLVIASIIGLLAVVFVQQIRIRALKGANVDASDRQSVSNTPSPSKPDALRNVPHTTRDLRRTQQDRNELARREHAETVERQLAEISAPLSSDVSSTMFHADVKAGQSVVTGGYQTADGRNQFTILKPKIITDRNGSKQIEIDSNMIAVSPEDTKTSGLDSLATNAKNTLQHAESWEESDVAGTMDLIGKSEGSEHLGQPKVIVGPGGEFTVNMTSDDQGTYTLSGTAELSPDGSGVVLKARIEQNEARK